MKPQTHLGRGPAALDGGPVILFDGICRLCEGWVRFTLTRDRKAVFRFAPLQGELGRRATAGAGLPGLDSIVLIDEEGVHSKSSAALRIMKRLGAPWVLASAFLVVPRPIRDAVYDLVARNRYRWFGRRDSCLLPEADMRTRFID
jgi:predicted DCC family thiol-disulfide oxidoreductase YuxK